MAEPHGAKTAKWAERLRQRSWVRFGRLLMNASMKSVLKASPNRRPEAEAGGCATLREIGTGCRAAALPKVRTTLRRCARFSKVRTLENPDVFFEDAHPFSKVRNFS
jgi:hypothetical protein